MAAVRGYGTLLSRARKNCAVLTTGDVDDDNAILWTASAEGTAGNSVSITLSNPGGTGDISVSVSGSDITITLARTSGTITSTAQDVIDAVKAYGPAVALVRPRNADGSDGTGLVEAVSKTNLSGGSDTDIDEEIGEVVSISGPSLSLDTLDATSLDSTDGWTEHVPSTLECGEMTVNLLYEPLGDSHGWVEGLIKDIELNTERVYTLTFADDEETAWSFTAVPVKAQPAASASGILTMALTLRPTGNPTLE